MDRKVRDELLLNERLIYVKLSEFEDLTRQLGEALDRRDEVSVQMLLNMRGEPAQQLWESGQQMQQYILALPEDDAIRAKALAEGAPQQAPEEAMLCAQVAQNQRLIARCQELDKHISQRMCGERSFYNKYR
mgnify:CR=1 FL=1